jgi:hypothetical protein
MNACGDQLLVHFNLSAQAPGKLSGINPANSKTYNKACLASNLTKI